MKFTEHMRLKMKLHLVSISSLLLLSMAAYPQTQIIPAGALIQCTTSDGRISPRRSTWDRETGSFSEDPANDSLGGRCGRTRRLGRTGLLRRSLFGSHLL
jgi:hypothetical protein